MNTTALRIGDTVSGFYFGEYAFQGVLTMVDSSHLYIELTTSCHRYAAGELIGIPRDDLRRSALKTIVRPESVVVEYDSAIGARYAA